VHSDSVVYAEQSPPEQVEFEAYQKQSYLLHILFTVIAEHAWTSYP
jgi:hypothetical protein